MARRRSASRRGPRKTVRKTGSKSRSKSGSRASTTSISSRIRRFRVTNFLPSASARRRWTRLFRSAPLTVQLVVGAVAIVTLWFLANGLYQVIRKPSELFFPVSGTLYKTPTETWDSYEPIFRRHATEVITPEFLAALAQVEASGNPIVRTYWRWSWDSHPFDVYRPASSAVGMYQITDGTFAEARHYCIRHHVVIEDGPWNDWKSCWFNGLYTRTVPSHAVELTSAYLDRHVARTLQRHRIRSATLSQKQDLAALIHLCGAGAGNSHARRGLRWYSGQRCGDHGAREYVGKVNAMKRVFKRLAAEE